MATTPSLIVGNWKMYKTIPEALDFVKRLIPQLEGASAETGLAVPYTCIYPLANEAKDSSLKIGAQNMNDASEGAFTGEIAARMLKQAGAQFVILGHSERRKLFQESNSFINRKIKRALKEGIRPILCVGESKEERENGRAEEVVSIQLKEGLEGINPEDLQSLVVSYEPVWAIGTHVSAAPEIAQEIQSKCRGWLTELLSLEIAQNIALLYGGSVNPQNALSYLDQPDINGLLLGGSSLSLESFLEIIHTASKITKEVSK